jgi:transcriptional regulator with XRE-family HTH domain
VDVATEVPRADEPVEVMKRRLRSVLRQARDAANMTQKEVADQQGWSVSKIVRIELGAVLPSPADVRALMSLYGEADSESVAAMADLAKRARERRGYVEYDDVYSAAAIELFGNEAAAKAIFKYESHLIPGLCQTSDYARDVLIAFNTPEDQLVRKLEVRVARQQILEGKQERQFHFIIGEAALRTPAGTAEVMRIQLEHLQELGARPGISIQVLPFSAGVQPGVGEAFTILQFEESLGDLLYIEDSKRESASRNDEVLINGYLDRFARLQAIAASTEETPELIRKVARECYPG